MYKSLILIAAMGAFTCMAGPGHDPTVRCLGSPFASDARRRRLRARLASRT